jgi:hypothetical protein
LDDRNDFTYEMSYDADDKNMCDDIDGAISNNINFKRQRQHPTSNDDQSQHKMPPKRIRNEDNYRSNNANNDNMVIISEIGNNNVLKYNKNINDSTNNSFIPWLALYSVLVVVCCLRACTFIGTTTN